MIELQLQSKTLCLLDCASAYRCEEGSQLHQKPLHQQEQDEKFGSATVEFQESHASQNSKCSN